MEKVWETIDMGVTRMRTPEGWLVRYSFANGAALCYVPDVAHDWD